jgi:hypothetical protein
MKTTARVLISILSIMVSFWLLGTAHRGFHDLLQIMIGAFVLIIPAFLLGPLITSRMGWPISSLYYPLSKNSNLEVMNAHRNVALTKIQCSHFEEAFDDYIYMINKWPYKGSNYIEAMGLCIDHLKDYSSFESIYKKAMNDLKGKERQMVEEYFSLSKVKSKV